MEFYKVENKNVFFFHYFYGKAIKIRVFSSIDRQTRPN